MPQSEAPQQLQPLQFADTIVSSLSPSTANAAFSPPMLALVLIWTWQRAGSESSLPYQVRFLPVCADC